MKKLALGLLFPFLCSCASILQSGPDKFMVNSNPTGAMVYIDDMPIGPTPVMAQCGRSSECVIKVEKEGYNTYIQDKDKVVAGWVFGNLILGGGIGVIVDLIAHNQGKYTEEPIFVNIAPSEKTASTKSK